MTWPKNNSEFWQRKIKDNRQRDKDKQLSGIPIIHAVIFPDIVVGNDETFGMYGHREVILDRTNLNTPEVALKRLFKHWGKERQVSTSEIAKLLALLAPTTTIRRLLSDEVADADKKLLQLTREQTRVLQGIKRNRYAAIIGGAGTGKTILAVEKAKQLSLSGFRVLILCYNGPLRDHIAKLIQIGQVEVHTFHSLVMREARKAKISVPASPPDGWFATDAAKVLSDAALKNHTGFDAMLIDEAQDFAPTWIEASRSMLSDDEALLYVFADSHQDLYRRDWTIPDGFAEYELTVNCRNTRPIAEKVAKVFGDDLDGDLVDGPKPQFVEIGRIEQLIPYVIQLIERLVVDENVQAAQIAVLTDSRIVVDQMRAMAVADCMFADLNGNGIAVETVSRFKGLERDIVILTFTDQVTAMERSALIYVGLSRAKAALYVVGSSTVRSWIGWDQ